MKCHEAACCKQGPDRGSNADPRPARQGLPFPPSLPPAHQGQPALQAPLALIDDVTGDTQGAAQAFGQEHVGVSSAGQQLLHNLGTDRPVSTRRAPPRRAEEAPGARPRGATSLLPTPRGLGSDGEAGGAHGGSLGRTPTPPGGPGPALPQNNVQLLRSGPGASLLSTWGRRGSCRASHPTGSGARPAGPCPWDQLASTQGSRSP